MASLNIGKVDTDKVDKMDRAHLADLVSTLPLLIRAHETLLTDTYIRQTICSCANLSGVFVVEISIAGVDKECCILHLKHTLRTI